MAVPTRALGLALLLVLALPLLWLSLLRAPALRVDVGEWGDHAYLSGVNAPERSARESYRWTTGQAELVLPNLGGHFRLLRLRLHGWRPAGLPAPRLSISADGQLLTSVVAPPQLQTYELLLPYDAITPVRRITLHSDLLPNTLDQRAIGVALDWAELRPFGAAAAPSPWQLAGQLVLLVLVVLLLHALVLPGGWAGGGAALIALALAAANAWQPLWLAPALPGMLLVLAGLLAATALARPVFARALAPWLAPQPARVVWGLFIAALALRLLGAIHPLFDMHDLPFHLKWLADVAGGQLYIYSTPSEFQNRPIFNPPAGYLLLLPLQLLLPPRLAIQAGVALADALAGLLLLWLARAAGLRAPAGIIAAVLYWALPINLTMLWWGFATNALAQPAGLLLFGLLLRLARRPRAAAMAAFGAACAAGMLMHIGALALLLALLGAVLVLGWRQRAPAGRWAVVGALLAALAGAGLIYFSAVIDVGFRTGGRPGLSALLAVGWADRWLRLGLVGRGLLLGFLPTTLALVPLGLAHLFQPRWACARTIVLAWLLACLLFLGAYLGLGMVVRYIYFAVPPICLCLGAWLEALWARRGRAVVIALLLLTAWGSAALWAAGVLMRIKPSVVPLTQ